MKDNELTVADLKAAVHRFIDARDWQQYHTPKNLAMGIGIEAAEIMEHFQWESERGAWERMKDPAVKAEVADEMADVFIYLMSLANATDIDLSDSVLKKLERNETRFPPEQWKGKAREDRPY